MRNLSSKGIRFSGDSIKSCVCFIDLVDSTKNTITMEGLENIRKYYSTFINSVSDIVKSSSGKVIKNIGDCLLFYFPKTSNHNNLDAFREVIDCGSKILNERYKINKELCNQNLPPFSYRITIDYGVLDLALVGDYSQIDLFGSTINICSKINSSLSVPNEIVIGDNFYRVLKSFPLISNDFNFVNNGEYKITNSTGYPTYLIKRTNTLAHKSTNFNDKLSLSARQLKSSVIHNHDHDYYNRTENGLSSQKKNNNKKRIILVDDEQDILFTYKTILTNYNYHVTSFTDPSIALNYIRDLTDFNDLLVVLDIRMKNLNGLQLHQQIKSIDPTIKIIFITALDILDELLSIVPGISQHQIMRKPIDTKEFTSTVEKVLNS
ncbi:MAG TPA: response regulator [Nitrososphaeraceae archaeon]